MEPPGPTPGAQETPGSERRQAPRFATSLKVNCYPVGGGLAERRQARIRNVSRTGIALAVDRSFAATTALVIELPVDDGVKAIRARVVHCTRQVGGTFLVGCVLDVALSDAEVQTLTRG